MLKIPVRHIGTVIVTGSNSGIGKATAAALAIRGWNHVILGCRDSLAAKKVQFEISEKCKAAGKECNVDFRHIDLTSLDSVTKFAEGIGRDGIQVDALINNAGILPPSKETKTADGYEITYQTNFLGHFLLSHLLYDNLKTSEFGGRIISTVADPRAFYLCWPPFGDQFYNPQQSYNQMQAYIKSKLAITLAITRGFHLKALTEQAKVSTFSVDPGVMDPSVGRNTSPVFKSILSACPKFLFKTFEQGAESAVYCADTKDLESKSGLFFQNCKPISITSRGTDDNMAKRLFRSSGDLVGLHENAGFFLFK